MNAMTSFLIDTINSLYFFEYEKLIESVPVKMDIKKFDEYIEDKQYSIVDSVIDIPEILNESTRELFYSTFNQLSFQCGTGELSLNYYTEIKCSKFRMIYEDGIGLSTVYMLAAMIENSKQVTHYVNGDISNLLLNDQYYRSVETEARPVLYVDIRNTDIDYLTKVKSVVATINFESYVEVIYINDEKYNDTNYMKNVLAKCDFINLDNAHSMKKYWESCLSYNNLNKLVCFHHLGYLYPLVDKQKLGRLHSDIGYSVSLYPIHEKNKRFQNGCLKIFVMDNSIQKLETSESQKNRAAFDLIGNQLCVDKLTAARK